MLTTAVARAAWLCWQLLVMLTQRWSTDRNPALLLGWAALMCLCCAHRVDVHAAPCPGGLPTGGADDLAAHSGVWVCCVGRGACQRERSGGVDVRNKGCATLSKSGSSCKLGLLAHHCLLKRVDQARVQANPVCPSRLCLHALSVSPSVESVHCKAQQVVPRSTPHRKLFPSFHCSSRSPCRCRVYPDHCLIITTPHFRAPISRADAPSRCVQLLGVIWLVVSKAAAAAAWPPVAWCGVTAAARSVSW